MNATMKIRLLAIAFCCFLLNACSESPDAESASPTEAKPAVAQAHGDSPGPKPVSTPDPSAEPAPAATTATAESDSALPPLPIESMGIIESLPDHYPESWFLVHDASFFSMSDGKVTVIDAAATKISDQVKGSFNISLIGSFAEGLKRSEIYTVETFYSRGTRGVRTDTLTIWGKANMEALGEIVLPGEKRYGGLPEHGMLQLLDDERFVLVVNMNPATSVTVIDVAERKIVAEIATPGCIKAFPTGPRGFSSICGDGRFLSTQLNEDGSLKEQTRGEVFFNSDTSPIFQRATFVDGIGYFPSFDGQIYPVDFTGELAEPGAPWHLSAESERAENWRPGGLGLIDSDSKGRMYVLMHPDGGDGSHQSGGAEVWVFDPSTQQRLQRIALKEWGLSLSLSRGEKPILLITNPVTMLLEVYEAGSGEHIQTLSDFFQFTPLLHAGAR